MIFSPMALYAVNQILHSRDRVQAGIVVFGHTLTVIDQLDFMPLFHDNA